MSDTRARIVAAAAQVMHTRGLARTTTKEIARAADCSEALLYKHFRAKEDLFLAVLRERTPGDLERLLGTLADRVGRGAVADTLTEVAAAALAFYQETFPMAASIFSEPRLLAAHRGALAERGAGPQHVNTAVADYLRAEQAAGRVRADADADALAGLLLGACFQRAFLSHLTDLTATPELAEALVRELLPGLTPAG
ncbi:TetR/AcrR family transcriptional regulator [Goodfellowiella coeruleoviolacea]|uniref:Transcriptional regulator, TetR family n=1 Tax=Goodfellowiella coeruleoviolacea TaxID=334858 RepID=A0AAE3KPM5_9PSEU|nr:TetR/AcrR family transcriptional regulator [Goodfellowiella coeruleoviolacea]MCP2170033.1 transcriptional regulator, TetR family [Goodfellowiella coeruleoviolacea]